MNNTEILYDHYKETVDITKNMENKRNKAFVIIIIHISVLLLMSYRPESLCNTIKDYLMGQWEIGFYFSMNIIQTIIMLSLLYCVVRYYQFNIHIEKAYPYIHKLEERLSKLINEKIERESNNYLKQYPKTQDLVYYTYKYIFPFLFIFALIYRFIFNNTWDNPMVKIAELFITTILIVINVVYTIDMYNQGKNN